jgi:peptidase E
MMRQLIVLGGGGFLMEKSRALDNYFLRATGKPNPRICFVGTASGDAESGRYKFYEAMAMLDCRATHLSLVQPPTPDLAAFVMEQDAIYVGGGNTRSLLALWREWGLDVALRAAYESGIVMGGISAGMICWFESGITDSVPGTLSPLPCLGWLPGSACPHYDGEAERRPAFHRLLAEGRIPPGYAADDGVALHFVDDALVHVVASRPTAKAFRLSIQDGAVLEVALPVRVLDGVMPNA